MACGKMEGQSGLRNPLRPDTRVVVDAQSGIEGEPGNDILAEVNISGQLARACPPDRRSYRPAPLPHNIFVPRPLP